MKNKIEDLPKDGTNIMVTYKRKIYFGVYSLESRTETITKRGFYSKIFNNISIPPEWKHFNGILLPHGFGGDHISLEEVINWELAN